jgi:hypothetical protein
VLLKVLRMSGFLLVRLSVFSAYAT